MMMRHPARTATLLLGIPLVSGPAWSLMAQVSAGPDTVAVTSGPLTLRGLLWRPAGNGPSPAVLFSHGSYVAADPNSINESVALGSLFARHGYVFLVLFRQGLGLSRGQGAADGDLMARAQAVEGVEGRNRVQLQLLETEELDETLAGLTFLRARPEVDPHRVAVASHSFGASLALLLAARDTSVRAVVAFSAAAFSWGQSPQLRARLLAAVGRVVAPVMFIHAVNDYSTAPGEALAGEMRRLGKSHVLKLYSAVGRTVDDGHNLVYRSVPTWESDVFRFLGEHLRR